MTHTTEAGNAAPATTTPVYRKLGKSSSVGIVAFAVVLVLIGATVQRADLLAQGATALTLAIAATGLGLALGIAGEFVLGISVVFATGAYTTAALMTQLDWRFWLAAVVGMALAIVVGIALSLPGLRIGKFYFGMLGFFVVFLIPQIAQILQQFTNGSRGLAIETIPEFFGLGLDATGMFFLAAAALIVTLLISRNVRSSPLGVHMRRMRESPIVLGTTGVQVWRIRLATYVLTSVFAGLGGAIYSDISGFLLPGEFSLDTTNLLLAAVIVGGSRSLLGPSIGVLVLYIVPRVVLDVDNYADIVYGAVVVLSVLLFRGGVTQTVRDLATWVWGRYRATRSAAEPLDPVTARSPQDLADTLWRLRKGPIADHALEVRGVRKSYGSVAALDLEDEDTITVRTGEIHLLLGPNGSGKTTMLNVMTGIVRPAAGSVTLDGRDASRMSIAEIARRGVGRSFQSPALPDEVTPLELFTASLADSRKVSYLHWLTSDWVAGRARRQARDLAGKIADQAGLGRAAHQACRGLTSGQRRIVDVMLSLLSSTSTIVLLDEPAAGLSDPERRQLAATIRALARHGLGFIVVEHDLDLALSLADTVTVMASGRPVTHGSADEVKGSAVMREVLIGAVE